MNTIDASRAQSRPINKMPILDIDLLSGENLRNPYDFYANLIALYPVCYLERYGLYAISRYHDVKSALLDNRFSSQGYKKLGSAEWLPEECHRDLFVLGLDGEEHKKYQKLIKKAFVPKVINSLTPIMEAKAKRLIETVINPSIKAGREFEFLTEFAYPYVSATVLALTGLEEFLSVEEVHEFLRQSEKISPSRPSDSDVELIKTTIFEFRQKLQLAINDRRKNPRIDDLLTNLINVEVDGQKLSDKMLCNTLDLLIVAGFHTTTHGLAQALLFLSQRSDMLSSLRKKPSDILPFINELLRYDSSATAVLRQTTEDISLYGAVIPTGATVMLMTSAANRDPQQFSHSAEFDLARKNNSEHLALGHGIHRCIGAAMGIKQMQIALNLLLQSTTSIKCRDVNELSWVKSYLNHGVTALPVHFNP